MLLPYYIAAMNIEHAYFELTGSYEPFEGLCFVDTLELAEAEQGSFSFMTEANTERVERQKKTPITVDHRQPAVQRRPAERERQQQEPQVRGDRQRIRETYADGSRATTKNALYDPYVKFFRWATDRLDGRDGIVCFVTNNSFVDRCHVRRHAKTSVSDFDMIYHLDLHGNVSQEPETVRDRAQRLRHSGRCGDQHSGPQDKSGRPSCDIITVCRRHGHEESEKLAYLSDSAARSIELAVL